MNLSRDLKENAAFSIEDIKKLQQIHLKTTGELLTDQQTIEMGTRIIETLKIVARPIPNS
jgi:hypothetical protein